jgi:hypothetical protein
MPRFVLTKAANADLKAIGRYTQATWGPDQRTRYLTLLDADFRAPALVQSPVQTQRLRGVNDNCGDTGDKAPFPAFLATTQETLWLTRCGTAAAGMGTAAPVVGCRYIRHGQAAASGQASSISDRLSRTKRFQLFASETWAAWT